MGYYALAGKEQDKRLKCVLKTYMQTDINKRRDYVKTLSLGTVERAMGKKLNSKALSNYCLICISLLEAYYSNNESQLLNVNSVHRPTASYST